MGRFKKADRLAEIQSLIDVLSQEAEEIKQSFRERGEGIYEGSEHSVSVHRSDRMVVDTTKVRKLLDARQLSKVSRKVEVTIVKVRLREE